MDDWGDMTKVDFGKLVYQEGKKIDGEYYIASVYDHAEDKRVNFLLLDLEDEYVCHGISRGSMRFHRNIL